MTDITQAILNHKQECVIAKREVRKYSDKESVYKDVLEI
jgi:hypothetical protein